MITSDEDQSHQEEAERIIASIKHCVDRGVDPQSGKRGKCHVFLSGSDKCVCEDVDLSRERMRVSETLQKRLFDECVAAKWDPERRNTFAEEIAHLHEELSEAFRAWRRNKDCRITIDENGKPQGVPIELADVLIGLFYNAELHGFDLLAAVEQKHQYNLTRNYVQEGRQLHAGNKG